MFYHNFKDHQIYSLNVRDNLYNLSRLSLLEDLNLEKLWNTVSRKYTPSQFEDWAKTAGLTDEQKETIRQSYKSNKFVPPGSGKGPSPSPSPAPTPKSSEPGLGKSLARGGGVLAVGIPAATITDIGLEAAGVKDPDIRDIASSAAGLGAGEGAMSAISAARGKMTWKDVAKRSGQGAMVGALASGAEIPVRATVERIPGLKNADPFVKDLATSAGSVAAAEGIISGTSAALGRMAWGAVPGAIARSAGVWGLGLPLAIKGIEKLTGRVFVDDVPKTEDEYKKWAEENPEKARQIQQDWERSSASQKSTQQRARGSSNSSDVLKKVDQIMQGRY